MNELTVWGLAILIFGGIQCVILRFDIADLKDKINDLEFKLDHKLASPTGAEGSDKE